MKLIITNPAENNLLKILNFIGLKNKNASKRIYLAFKKTFDTLKNTPHIGRKRVDLTKKEVLFFCLRKNYLIVYEIIDDTVIILRILTSYQDISNRL